VTDPRWIALRIRELREERGWSQATLAAEAGIPAATIANIEQGRTAPSWATVCLVANALGEGLGRIGEQPEVADWRGPGRPPID